MRLLHLDDVDGYSLTPDLPSDDVPSYAILSHTWGPDEVLFADLAKPSNAWQHKAGYEKIKFCAKQARRNGLRYIWIDTCCIDKSDAIELQTAINSMFRWYRDAKRCYVYLPDVSLSTMPGQQQNAISWKTAFRGSRWFTRGWTLQELIAPKAVDFYSNEGSWIGDKRSLETLIRDITGIPANALRGTPLSDFTVSEREAWARNRQTKYEEDLAYCLLGMFDVYVLPNYGEGRKNAQRRLREEVHKAVKGTFLDDFSISFSLSKVPEIQHFVSREEELAKIRRALNSDGSRRIVTLHGLGGIGKTQIAVAYAKRYRNEYSAIFWLNIKDEASIQQSFTKVARQILQQHPNASRLSTLDLQQNHEEVVEAVKAWLSLPGNTRWLLVYDNYDNPRLAGRTDDTAIDVEHFLPTAYQGSMIITTRSSQVSLGETIRIRKLETIEDGLQILLTTSGRDSLHDDDDARRLVKKLDGLPLALATAGAYLKRVSNSCTDYLRLYEQSWARLHTSTPRLGSYQDRTLCSTWQISYEQVQKQNRLAAHLLRWWAYFDNEDIWFELVQHSDTSKKDDEEVPAWMSELTDELNFNGAMGALHDYGLLEAHILSQEQIGSRGYSIHSCLHAWAIHILNQDWDEHLSKLAVKCVASRVPSQDDAQFWVLQRRLLPHALKCRATMQGSDEKMSWACHNLGLLYSNQDKLQEAEEMYMRALQGQEKAWGPDHTLTLDMVHNLGALYFDQGKLQEAEEMYMRALQGKEKTWGPEHTSTLFTVNSLGLLYFNQGKLQEAEEMYMRALQGYEKAIAPQHIPRYRPAINTTWAMASLLRAQGNVVEARRYYERAYDNLEALLGPLHNDVQALRNVLMDFNKTIEVPMPTEAQKSKR
ncbi:P-loop containing nucleoside triphosphate hydrolase protein [Xylariaceae sp. FL0016]|nr:P-loop containing nucleoside triphosphate hydrolase protein [Xylariaceae sp. FL0016]